MIFAQKGITFQIEELSKPTKLLQRQSYNDILHELILRDAGKPLDYKIKPKVDLPLNIVASSHEKDSLVNYEFHSFFDGMYEAYANHRPFVMSPDMIWLLISQGFAQHVNNNSEELRKLFVSFNKKTNLVVYDNRIILENPKSPWEEVFPVFTKKIGEFTGAELMNDLTCDFSTTTPISKVASEITIMEAMKPYFKYVVIRMICGIPQITLEGTPEDWQKVLAKAKYLRKYKLDWWMDEVEPLLQQFVNASKGNVDKDFWKNMFKYHTEKVYGSPQKIDGWIVKFYPYSKTGTRNNLKELVFGDNLPSEIVKVDLLHITIGGPVEIKTPLELWAGFVGLKQNPKTFALTPQIGWLIKRKDLTKEDKDQQEMLNNFKSSANNPFDGSGINISVNEVPKALLKMDYIKMLTITFTDKIVIPEEMGKIKIDFFRMYGTVSDDEVERICKLFPNTLLDINGKEYNEKNEVKHQGLIFIKD